MVEEEIRRIHGIKTPLADVSVDDTFLTFVFAGSKSEPLGPSKLRGSPHDDLVELERTSEPHAQRRRRRKRSRIRTAGWEVIAKFTNSKGLRCNIYKPIYEALSNPDLGEREAALAVREVIKKNRNPNPASASVQYFLQNTLEYISSQRGT